MRRVERHHDPGDEGRVTDSATARRGGIYDEDDGQLTFTDGQGNQYWFVDTSGGNVTITLPDPTEVAADTIFTVKRITGGANSLTVQPGSGTIDGAASHSIAVQWQAYSYISNGSAYYII